jgi:asparagine synthase (glutamine-hydrolysing)
MHKVFDGRDKHPGFPFWRVINLEMWSKAYGIGNL